MKAFRRATESLLYSAECLEAFARAERTREGRVGGLLVAEALFNLRVLRRAIVGGR